MSIGIVGTIGDVTTREVSGRNGPQTMASFSVRESGRKPKDGGNRPAFFWDCVAFGQLADQIAKKFTKGTRVVLLGRTEPQEWEKDGQTRRKPGITVEELGECCRFDDDSSGPRPSSGGSSAAKPPPPSDDVPF